MWEINEQVKMIMLFFSYYLSASICPSRNPGGKSNCLAVSIIYQHGNIMVLIIKFERTVLSLQLCSENFLIGGNLFPKNKTIIIENWWGERGYRYRTFREDKYITCRIMESYYRAWVGERVKRVMAAPKCLHRRKFGAAKWLWKGRLKNWYWSYNCIVETCLHLEWI